MSRVVLVDPIGGAAGDMLLAALLDAGAPEGPVREAVEAVLPGRFLIVAEEVDRRGLRARHLRVEEGPEAPPGGLSPRPAAELIETVRRAELPAGVRERALAVLGRLAEAEARVHGVPPDDVHLHELGDDDTLLDVVGVAAALEALGVERVLVGEIPLAPRGTIRTAHGEIPLPGPATLELLRGFAVRWEGEHERVTPTAAAIVAALGEPGAALPPITIEAVGYGAGTADPPDVPNVVRVLLGVAAESHGPPGRPPERSLVVLEANLDDLAPELVADAQQALLEAGALDAWTVPIQMKKGRAAVTLAALCEPELRVALTQVFFEATSTFGVRATAVRRTELDRRTVRVELPGGGTVRVKVGFQGDRVTSVKPEHDEVAALAARTGRPVRVVHEEAVAAALTLRDAGAEERR
ncbi:MAG: nickel pincer cofactor biosynthesis protein LarC [Actinobacteria bacterium]|nr:nickel pincer cofactor biosynthesis protein LarC [Actinomycetota bacterium]